MGQREHLDLTEGFIAGCRIAAAIIAAVAIGAGWPLAAKAVALFIQAAN